MHKRFILYAGAVVLILSGVAVAYCLGWWMPNCPGTTQYPLRGIDVSHHQGKIDWKAVSASDIGFVYIKASEGGDFQDDRFQENLEGATQAGLPCGAYHFFTLKASGIAQAQNFIRAVSKNRMRLPPAVDLETWGDSAQPGNIQDYQSQLSDFMNEVRKAFGTEPIIYTSSDYIQAYLPGYPIKRLWMRAVFFTPNICGFPDWRFWQFTEKARVKGIDGFVDMDVFQGSKAEFESSLITIESN